MAAGRYLKNGGSAGTQDVAAAIVATPDSIVGSDASGRIDISFMPVGVGAEVTLATATETIASGAWVNIYNNAGTISVRNADATTAGKPAHGFVLAGYINTNMATVYRVSNANSGLTGLTLGAQYFLSTTPGVGVATTPPSTSGNIVQRLGIANKTTEIVFEPYAPIEIV